MKKVVLMNPGPVNVTKRVRNALLKPDICHREEEFSKLLLSIRKKIVGLFGVGQSHTVALLTGPGTMAVECMLMSLAEKNKKVLVLSNGVYGERIRTILQRHGFSVVFLETGLREFPTREAIESALKKDRKIHAIAMVHHETSSGRLNPLEKISDIAKKYNKALWVDAISSIGAEPIDFKRCKIEALAGVSGKCLHAFPGVAWVLLSKKAASRLKKKKSRSLVLDLGNILAWEEENDTPFTPAVQLFYAFDEALDELIGEGLKTRIQNYAERSELVQRGLQKLGIRCLIPDLEHRSHVLSAFWLPKYISYERLHRELKERGFVIYAGQSRLKNRIFRIANLGDIQISDLRRFLKTFRDILKRAR